MGPQQAVGVTTKARIGH